MNIIVNDKNYKYEDGVTLKEISKDFEKYYKYPIMAGFVGGEIYELSKTIDTDTKIEFFDFSNSWGRRMYINGLIFILIYAVNSLYGEDAKIKVCHSIDKGKRIKVNFKITQKKIDAIKKKMRSIIDEDLEFTKCIVKRGDAQGYFRDLDDYTKVNALNYVRSSHVYLYKLGNIYDYFYSKMPYSTGYIKEFDLTMLDSCNFVLQYPTVLGDMPSYSDIPLITNAYNENYKHAKMLDIFCADDINKAMANGRIKEIIKLDELNANDRLLTIAKEIVDKKCIKLVLLAGPSSSGKTTTARKLSMYLKSFGLNPKPLSIDDYFIDRDKTPKLPSGEYDYESLKAINVSLLNEHLTKLLNHEEVSIPTYNFYTGKSEYLGNTIKLDDNDILIVEGLHGLNEELTRRINSDVKVKIYVSPLTDLNIDSHNMISTSDVRLLRRIIRDYRTRGYSLEDTFKIWPLVRDGERKYILPFQGNADYVYNTAYAYEIGALKVYAEPLLYQIHIDSPYYEDARRLIDFLSMFMAIPLDAIPNDSLIREFIGDSYFD